MIFLRNDRLDPAFSLALEEHLLRSYPGEEFFMLWRDPSAVVCGRNQNVFEEVNAALAEKSGVTVIKRFSGGGTVYHDEGNVNYTFISDADGTDFEKFITPVISALRDMGVSAELSGTSDIVVCGRKISGNAQAQTGGRVLHHGTLLYSSDLSRLDLFTGKRIERRAAGEITSKSVKSRVAGVANIADFLKNAPSVEDFMEELGRRVAGESVPLSAEDSSAAERLADEKYRTWDWTFGTCPRFSFSGELDGKKYEYTAYHGVIEACSDETLVGTRLAFRELAEKTDEKTAEFLLSGEKQ